VLEFADSGLQGGTIVHLGIFINQVTAATADFAANCSDPKAQIITTYEYVVGVVSSRIHTMEVHAGELHDNCVLAHSYRDSLL